MAERRNLQQQVKDIFFRKNLERQARNVRLNVTNAQLRQFIADAVARPVLNNQQYQANQQRIQAEQQRVQEIEGLRERLNHGVGSFNRLEAMGYHFTPADVERLFQNAGQKIALNITFEGGRTVYMTFTRRNLELVRGIMINRRYIAHEDEEGSDQWTQFIDIPIERFQLVEIRNPRANNIDVRRGDEAFFRYLNTTDIPLERYQIYTLESQTQKNDDKVREEEECCLLFVLNEYITIAQMKELKFAMKSLTTNISLSDMEKVAQIIKKQIQVIHYDEKSKRNRCQLRYGKKFEEVIEMAQFKNHFFIMEDTPYTSYYIEHHDEIEAFIKEHPLEADKDKRLLNRFTAGKYYSHKPKLMTSLDLVVELFKQDKFTSYNVSQNPCNNYEVVPSLENIEENQKIFRPEDDEDEDEDEEEEKHVKEEDLYIFGDCESDVSKTRLEVEGKEEVQVLRHEMIAFGWSCNGFYEKVVYKTNQDEFAEAISNALAKTCYRHGVRKTGKKQNKKVIIFFHNVKYDSSLFQDMFYSNNEVKKDNTLYSKTYFINYGLKVEFRDSYKHFGGRLADASKTFGLCITKQEAINYTFHTKENISKNELVKTTDYMTGLKESDKPIFLANMKEGDFEYNGEEFNASKYYLYYLKHDVQVLEQAMKKYRELIFDITGLDAYQSLTISSIGYKYATKEGCFDGLAHVKGCLREFIQKSIKGGRVYVNPKYQCSEVFSKEEGEGGEDFDGVSVYPSSMERLCKEFGLPKGLIKKGLETSKAYYDSKDWYMVRVLVKKINKAQQIPCISMVVKTEKKEMVDGKEKKKTISNLRYLNELPCATEFYLDKTTLEDWITYHEIDYEIIEGVYWDEGFNTKLGQVIRHLHEERCKYKKTNVPKANMIKLIMNSIYGKTGMRSSETQTKWKKLTEYEKYIYDYYGTISEWEVNKFNVKITQRIFDTSYSLNYVASSILSMSKRIMNEVFSTMDENKMPVFYTDTDSIHMLAKHVGELGQAYNDKYGRELIGKNLGQFHTDFSMKKNSDGSDKYKDVISVKHIPIRPKIYFDLLQGTNILTGEIEYDTHCRIKGITQAGVNHQVDTRMKENKKLNRLQATEQLFHDIKDGKRVDFIMNPTDHDVCFEYDMKGVKTRKTGWVRSIKLGSVDVESDHEELF